MIFIGLALSAISVDSAAPMLASLLAKTWEFEPEYDGGLSNHASMILVALSELGASDKRLLGFFNWYSQRLIPFEPSDEPAFTEGDWTQLAGRRKHYASYRLFFAQRLSELGRDSLLRRYLPALMPGVAAGAFHPLIQLAYALHADSDAGVVCALAYWADAYLPLGAVRGGRALSGDPAELLHAIRQDPSLANATVKSGMIDERMRQVAKLPSFGSVVDWLAVHSETQLLLAHTAIRLYVLTGDFVVLHLVTGTHAMRKIAPYLGPNAEAAYRHFFQGFAAGYITIGTPPLPSREGLSLALAKLPAWPELFRMACSCTDEHVIKLVYSCSEEDRAYPHPYFRYAAQRAIEKDD